MKATFEVMFSPAEFETLSRRDLSQTICVVFDVLRATSTMAMALSNGAAAVVPVASIPEALRRRQQQAAVLLAGEREGVRIQARLTGGIAFDLGNSPREFTRQRVQGKTIVMTTTNGTRALRACAGARKVLICSFLNLRATAHFLAKANPPRLLLVCGGTVEEPSYEDALGAGALCDLLWPRRRDAVVADSALMARRLFRAEAGDLAAALGRSRNGRRLLALAELREDVAFCAQRDLLNLAAGMGEDGAVRKLWRRPTGSARQ
ncbi:MAG: 2-phosphosulfolactate phosphatase [Verrucomicrobiota bacterium]|jgi:2-phosphosulfolactate phosphatase